MVGGVVLKENGAAAAIMRGQALQETQVGASIEDQGLLIVEANTPKFDRAQDLLFRSPVTGISDGWLTRLHVACRVESCRKLAPSVRDQRPVLGASFFLRRG